MWVMEVGMQSEHGDGGGKIAHMKQCETFCTLQSAL